MKKSLINKLITVPLFIAGLAAGAPQNLSAEEAKPRFYHTIESVIANPSDVTSDDDGRVYVWFSCGLDTINAISAHPENFDLTSNSNSGKEIIYQTKEEANRYRPKDGKFLAEINVDKKDVARYGHLSNLYNSSGEKLKGNAVWRGLDSPLKFEYE